MDSNFTTPFPALRSVYQCRSIGIIEGKFYEPRPPQPGKAASNWGTFIAVDGRKYKAKIKPKLQNFATQKGWVLPKTKRIYTVYLQNHPRYPEQYRLIIVGINDRCQPEDIGKFHVRGMLKTWDVPGKTMTVAVRRDRNRLSPELQAQPPAFGVTIHGEVNRELTRAACDFVCRLHNGRLEPEKTQMLYKSQPKAAPAPTASTLNIPMPKKKVKA